MCIRDRYLNVTENSGGELSIRNPNEYNTETILKRMDSKINDEYNLYPALNITPKTGLLVMFPGEQFEVKVTSNKDNLASLLASAMMTGYFLRQMEQRKELEDSLLTDEEMSIKPDDLNL